MPDRSGECEDALEDSRCDTGAGSPAVAFEIELSLERLVHGLDDLTERRAVAAPPCGLTELEARVNVKLSRIELLLKNLEVEGVVVADGQKYQRTPLPFTYDSDRTEAITALRRTEQEQMLAYATLGSGCRMVVLGPALDDPHAAPCGLCDLSADPPLVEAIARRQQ